MQIQAIPFPLPGRSDYHVVPNLKDGLWIVRQENSQVRYAFDTKREAVLEGSRLAREDAVSLLIHNSKGVIRDHRHYGPKAA